MRYFYEMAKSKKPDFFKTIHSQKKFKCNFRIYLAQLCCVLFFCEKNEAGDLCYHRNIFLKNESTFLERPSLFSLTNFQFSSQNKLIDMHCESSQKYFIGSFVEHLDICKKIKSNARFIDGQQIHLKM